MPPLPAVCDACGTVWPAPINVTRTASISNVRVSPCPSCGSTGSIPDGFYEFTNSALGVIGTWSPVKRENIALALGNAQAQGDRAAVQRVLEQESDLWNAIGRLLIPRDAGQFWAFIAALLAAFALLSGSAGETTITEQTVIERVTAQPAPTVPGISIGSARRPSPTKKRSARKKRPPKQHGKSKRKRHR
jgi:hypothetical protein